MAAPSNIKLWKNAESVRGLAILFVVLNHSIFCVYSNRICKPLSLVPFSRAEVISIILGRTVPAFSVAAFMLVSGYFMARFSGNWPAVWSSLRLVGSRYLAWSIAGFLAMGLLRRHIDLGEVLQSLRLVYGPFPAYWFLGVMVCVLVLCPWLCKWAVVSPISMLIAIGFLELVRAIAFYGNYPIPFRIPIEMSVFLLGIMLAKHTDVVVGLAGKYRCLLGYVSLVLLVAALAETAYWWNLLHVRAPLVTVDRFTARLYSLAASAWLLSAPTKAKPGWLTSQMQKIGLKSLAIILTFDLLHNVVTMVGWHIEQFLKLTTRPVTEPPPWMAHPIMVLVYFAVGLAGPLLALWIVERALGKRWRRLVFGC